MADTIKINQRFFTELEVNQRTFLQTVFEETNSTITKYEHKIYTIANGATNFSIGMGNITTGKRLTILTDRSIAVSLDGTSKYWSVTADTTPPVKGYVQIKGSFTAINVNNASGGTATVEVFMEGT